MDMEPWQRPESIPFPKVWTSFESNSNKNGVKNKYWIQDLTEDYYDEVIYHMSTGYITETPLCRYSNFIEHPESVQDYVAIWRKVLDLKLSLICLTKNENGETLLVGCNILGRSLKNEHVDLQKIFKGKASKVAAGALLYVFGLKDIYSEINSDVYLSAYGLYVLPKYRDQGIGYELLKSRREIALAVDLDVSVTLFTTIRGQVLADKVGFKHIIEFPYVDLKKVNSLLDFPGIENDVTKSMKLMFIRYK